MRRSSFFCLDVRFGQAKQGSHLGRNKYPAVFRFGTRGLSVLFGSAGKKSETSEHKPNFGNKTAGRGKLKQGVWSVDLGFFTALPEMTDGSMRQISEPSSTLSFS